MSSKPLQYSSKDDTYLTPLPFSFIRANFRLVFGTKMTLSSNFLRLSLIRAKLNLSAKPLRFSSKDDIDLTPLRFSLIRANCRLVLGTKDDLVLTLKFSLIRANFGLVFGTKNHLVLTLKSPWSGQTFASHS